MSVSFGVASCARISSASTPPSTKKPRLVTMYRIPMRLWSAVVTQLMTVPCLQETGYGSALAATRPAPLRRDVPLDVVEERAELRVRPALADGGHEAAAVADDRLEPGRVREQRVAAEVRADESRALRGDHVALRADAGPLLRPEVGRAGLLRARL